jgi:hypothetical protein
LVDEAIEREGIEITQEEIDQAVDDQIAAMKRVLPNEQAIEKMLKQKMGIGISELRSHPRFKKSLLMRKLFEKKFHENIVITEEEIKNQYDIVPHLSSKPFDEVKDQAKELVMRRKQKEFAAGFSKSLFTDARIVVPREVQTTTGRTRNAEDDIVDLLTSEKIEVQIIGKSISSMTIKVRRTIPEPVEVLITAGTYFFSHDTSVQNMITTSRSQRVLNADNWVTMDVDVACANRARSVPGTTNSFEVLRHPFRSDLVRLMREVENSTVDFPTKQAAVWIVTDNASYADLGALRKSFGGITTSLGPSGPRLIGEKEALAAMELCEKAGIDLRKKAIWKDREALLKSTQSDQ